MVIQFSSQRLLGAALFLSLLTSACGRQEPEAQAPPPVSVELQTLEESTVVNSNRFVGTLEATQRVLVAPRVDGRITKIAVSEGAQVDQGQLLVQLQLEREQAEVNARTSEINAQRANLRNAEAQLRAAQAERDRVAAEIESRRAEIASAQAELQSRVADVQSRQADLELAQSEFERSEFLVQEGAQAQQSLDQRTRDRAAAVAQRNSAREVQVSARSARDAARSSLAATQQSLTAAEQQVEAARATVEQEQANLAQAEAQRNVSEQDLSFNRVAAPISGVVGDITPKVGDYVSAGQEITTLIQNDALNLNINVPIEDASRLRTGLPVEIVNQGGEVEATGRISFVSPTVGQNAQTILAKATFDNNGSLRNEQFVQARVIWESKPGVLVPTEAITRIGGQSFVYVAQEQESEEGETMQVAKQRAVELGDIQGQNYQVVSGVQAGDELVVSGIQNLSDGAQISQETVTSEQ